MDFSHFMYNSRIMFVLAILVLWCDFLIKVRSNEFPGSEKSLRDYASIGIRSFFIDPAQFSWPYGLQASKNAFLDKYHNPGMQPNHFKEASMNQRMPRLVDMDKKIKLNQPMDILKFHLPNWLSQLFSDPSNSVPTKMAAERPLPLSLYYAKPNTRHYKDRFVNQEMKLPNVPMSSLMEKKGPFLVEKQLNKFPAQLTVEQFMQLQGDKYRMQTDQTVIEKPVPIPYTVEKHVPYPVEKPMPYPVEKLVPYPVPVPVRTPVEIPVPVPMIKFDPIFVPVREHSTENHAVLWMKQNFTSTTEAKDPFFNESLNLLATEQFEEGQTASTKGQFEINSVSSNYEQPANTSPVAVLQTQLLDASKVDSQFAASDKSGDTTELTSRPSVSSSPSP